MRTDRLFQALFLWLACFLPTTSAFTFSLSTPIQCANLTVNVVGGTPPYELLLIPIGNVVPETRRIVDRNITGGATTDSFKLAYPAKSQFLALMSDATGVGTGGTGVPVTVAANDDDSCLTVTASPLFYFYIDPLVTNDRLTQCSALTFSWNSSAVGQVSIYGVIPGGQTFRLEAAEGNTAFPYTVNIRSGSSVQFIAGDNRGKGTGGSVGLYSVTGNNDTCINASSPSSTAESPAGGVTFSPSVSDSSTSVPASTTSGGATTTTSGGAGGGGGGNSGGSNSHAGAIAGGVVGGVVGLALIAGLLFFFCRRKAEDRPEQSNIDLMQGEEPPRGESSSSPPMIEAGFYHPEPFIVPEPGSSAGRPSTELNLAGTARSASTDLTHSADPSIAGSMPLRNRRVSQQSLGQMTQSTADPSTIFTPRTGRDRKSHPPSAMRATNFVQHEDGGALDPEPPAPAADEEQVVELPPTYASVRKPGGSGNAEGS